MDAERRIRHSLDRLQDVSALRPERSPFSAEIAKCLNLPRAIKEDVPGLGAH